MMRKLFALALAGVALVCAAAPAFADDVAKRDTVILPASLLLGVESYLITRPYAEVKPYMAALDGCVNVQVPNKEGALVSNGECPEVRAELDRQAAETARATKRAEEAEAKLAAQSDAPLQ